MHGRRTVTAISDAFGDAAARWVGVFARRAVAVVVIAVALAAAAGTYTAGNLDINTDTGDLISPDLPFRRHSAAFEAAFPQFSDGMAIVIEGDTVDRAADAQATLTRRLVADKKAFHTVFAPETEPFFARNGLLHLDVDELADLSDRLADAQPLLVKLARDPSLRGLFDVLGTAVEEIAKGETQSQGLDDVLARIERVATAVAAGTADRAPRPLSWSDMLRGTAAEPADRRRFIMVQPALDYSSLQPAAGAMAKVRAHARALGLTADRGVRLRLTGSAGMASEELASVSRGASLAGLISLVLVGALLGFGVRSLRLVVAVLATLLIGLVWTAGFTTLAIGHLNLISVAFAVLFIGLGVDFGIHFGLRYKEEIEAGGDHGAALDRATRGVAGALGTCSIAAAASFYAFLATDYRGLSELGLIAGTGMFIALLANLTVLPALLTLMPLRPGSGGRPTQGELERFLRRHGRPVSIAALVLGVAAAMLLPSARFDANPIALKDPTTESVRTFLELMRDSETAPYTIQVLTSGLAEAKALAARLDGLAAVDRTVTLAGFIPSDQSEKLEIIEQMSLFLAPLMNPAPQAAPGPFDRRAVAEDFRRRLVTLARSNVRESLRRPARDFARALERIPDEAGLTRLERALLLFLPARLSRLRASLDAEEVGIDDLSSSVRLGYLSPDGLARVQVFPAENVNDDAALRRFVAAVRAIAPTATDSPVEIVEAGNVVVGAVAKAAIIALIAIAILLAAVMRDPRDCLLVMVPLVLAAVFTVAVSVLLDLPFNFANVIVLPLLVGLGVASGIHLVSRVRAEGGDVALMQTSTPRAVILSALTTVGSFGSLSVSSHRGTASMGELLTIAITLTLICTLVVLPALMSWTASSRDRGR